MIGYQPWPYMKYCWQYFTAAICTVSIRIWQNVISQLRANQLMLSLTSLHFCLLPQQQIVHLTVSSIFVMWSFKLVFMLPFFFLSFSVYITLHCDMVHSTQIQQHLWIPLVGLHHRRISCSIVNTYGSSVDAVRCQCHSRNSETGMFTCCSWNRVRLKC